MKRMKIISVFIVLCAVDLTIAIPLRQSLFGFADEEHNIPEKGYRTEAGPSVGATETKTDQGRGTVLHPKSAVNLRAEGSKSRASADKRRFSDSAYWDSFSAPDPYLRPIYLQNWDSEFGRNYRAAVDGHHPPPAGRRLRPVSGIYENAESMFGGDTLQNWRALYGDERF